MASLEMLPKKLVIIILSLYFLSIPHSSLGNSTCTFQQDQERDNNNRNMSGNNNIKGMFVFGSSLVDNGNNNFFENRAKSDYLPYGIDFAKGPTGRFTNGKNLVDLLGESLDLPSSIPPFKDPETKGVKIVYGVNHASGSSGILDETGSFAGNVTSLNQQIREFEEVTLPDLEEKLGCNRFDALPYYLFLVGIGGNDIMFNYFVRGNFLRADLQAFIANLIATLATNLQKLYNYGARKFAVTTIYPLGNCPMVDLNMPNCRYCKTALNQAAQLYNANLNSLRKNLDQQMPGAHIVIIDTYKIVTQILSDPSSNGFKEAYKSCCQVLSRVQGGNGVMCERNREACGQRTSYVYFDALHPTEAVNVRIAQEAYASPNNASLVYPINVQQLSQLPL